MTMDESHTAPFPADWAEQVSALLESSAQLQRSAALLLAQIHRPYASQIDLHGATAPQSAQASVLGAGVPIPSQGWKKDHSPKEKIIARCKARLMKDGWEDCEDTDIHATRLSEAMLRLGMEDMDNFATEASRLNCSNMAISATLVSAVVATFVANTYNEHDTLHMRVVNGLWLLSLFMSLAVATLCMLVSEWLTWSTSQELRDLSFLYRLIRTAFRSLFMHLSIFLFFAGLMVLMWNESTVDVCIGPTIGCGIFVVYYIIATVRAPFFSFFHRVKQFDDHDFRGLRVQIWTPFTLGTHHTLNYFFLFFVNPIQQLVREFNKLSPKSSDRPRPSRPALRTQTTEFGSTQKDSYELPESHRAPLPFQDLESLSPTSIRQPHPHPHPPRARERSPLSVRTDDGVWVDSPPGVSRVGTPLSHTDLSDVNSEDVEFKRRLKATRMRRLTEQEVMRTARSPRGVVEI